MRALLLTCVFGAIAEFTTAQSLSTCAQTCVSLTKAKCSPSDFTCACASEPYINKLATCFWKTCNEADSHDAIWYLLSLCNDAGVPLKRIEGASSRDNDNGEEADDYFSPSPPRLELRRDASGYVEERQIASFINNPTASATSTDVDIFPSATPTSPGSSDNITAITGTRGSHATTVALQIGLGVSIGLLSLVAFVWLGVWFLKERKKEKAAAAAGHAGQYPTAGPGASTGGAGQPGMTKQPGGVPAAEGYKESYTTTPAELSQNAQYSGHEMATHGGNTAEMGAPLHHNHPGGYSNAATPAQMVQQQHGRTDNPMHHPQQQVYHEVPGQHAPPGPAQQTHHLAEVPGRSATPNLYE